MDEETGRMVEYWGESAACECLKRSEENKGGARGKTLCASISHRLERPRRKDPLERGIGGSAVSQSISTHNGRGGLFKAEHLFNRSYRELR